MANRGAPIGNTNGAKGKNWRDAIRLALARRSDGDYRRGLAKIAERLVEAAENGDMAALKEIGDREDGKPQQSIDAEFRGSLTSVIEALPMHRLRELPDKDEPELLPAPGNGQ